MFLLTTNLVRDNRIKARIFFTFLKNILNQTWNALAPNSDLSENIGKVVIK